MVRIALGIVALNEELTTKDTKSHEGEFEFQVPSFKVSRPLTGEICMSLGLSCQCGGRFLLIGSR